jgi:branched-chain amino acid transport system permease protein
MKRRAAITVALWLVLLALPWWLPLLGGYTALGTKVLVYGLAAMALNLMIGFTGALSFGHAAWFGLGCYGAGLTLKYLAHSTPLAVAIGTAVAGVAAAVLGPLVMRKRGIYFAMITIAFGQLFYFIAVRWNDVTGGEDGLTGFARQPIELPGAALSLDTAQLYYVALLLFALGTAVMAWLLRSPLGHTWIAIRENRRRLQFLGVRNDWFVWAAFGVSGLLTGLAGSLNALLFNFASPQDLHYTLSGNFAIMVVLGGMRSFWGPLVGVVIFVVAQDYLSSLTRNWMTFVGLLFILIVLLFPKGVLGVLEHRGRAT